MERTKKILIIASVSLIILGIALFFLLHTRAPSAPSGDITKGGTGINLTLYDSNGNPIKIPSWFSAAYTPSLAIVTGASPPSCTQTSQCPGYSSNPNILCWNSQCVLGNVASLSLGVSVSNPSSSQISFTNLAPTSVSPSGFSTALNNTAISTLAPGNSASWTTTPMSISGNGWVGTTQTFIATVTGTNSYTGGTVSASGSVQLTFKQDPTGSIAVSVLSPV